MGLYINMVWVQNSYLLCFREKFEKFFQRFSSILLTVAQTNVFYYCMIGPEREKQKYKPDNQFLTQSGYDPKKDGETIIYRHKDVCYLYNAGIWGPTSY